MLINAKAGREGSLDKGVKKLEFIAENHGDEEWLASVFNAMLGRDGNLSIANLHNPEAKDASR